MTITQLKSKINSAKQASRLLVEISAKKRKLVLLCLAKELIASSDKIIKANAKDLKIAQKMGKNDSFINRLTLDKKQIKAIARSVKQVASASDKLGEVLDKKKRPSGITVKKVRVPLGLIAIIYESRPNVTVDAFVLTFKSGNAVILKGGKEIKNTNKVFVGIIKKVLTRTKINPDIIQDFSGISRALSSELFKNKSIDCMIPRGGKGLINFVKDNAKVPVIITGASVVHTYVDQDADLNMARQIVINAKTRRVSICNALDVLLIHKKVYQKLLKLLANDLAKKDVEIRADSHSYGTLTKLKYPYLKKAVSKDFDTEFLDYVLAVKVINNLDEALDHIQKHTLGHSEAIITSSRKKADKFFQTIDAACLYWNTSTQFSDGGEYGLGAEIGISTQKLHARGPFAHEALTTYKYVVTSRGAIRKN
jgi:glutamate-5-semialdehyde dehydrogenase